MVLGNDGWVDDESLAGVGDLQVIGAVSLKWSWQLGGFGLVVRELDFDSVRFGRTWWIGEFGRALATC